MNIQSNGKKHSNWIKIKSPNKNIKLTYVPSSLSLADLSLIKYSYTIIFSKFELDRCRFDNYDDRWEVSTKPHHSYI